MMKRVEMRSGAVLRDLVERRSGQDKVDLEPGCAYGVVTRQMVDMLRADVRQIKGRIDALFSLVAGAIVIEILLRLTGFS